MKWLASVLLFFAASAAHAADSAWVQAAVTGYEARVATAATDCPVLRTDGGDVAMTVRAAADESFPLLCAAPIPAATHTASIAGRPLAIPVANPQRILVLGDGAGAVEETQHRLQDRHLLWLSRCLGGGFFP